MIAEDLLDAEYDLKKTEAMERVEFLNGEIFQNATYNLHKTREMVRESHALSEEFQYTKGLAYVTRNRGVVLFFDGKPEAARKCFASALKEFKARKDDAGQASALFFLGLIHWGFGELEEGFRYTTKSLELSEKINDWFGRAWALNMLGGYYYDLEDYEPALELFEKAHRFFSENEGLEGEARALNGIGNTYFKLGRHEEAIEYQDQSLKIVAEYKNKQVESKILNDLGRIFDSIGDTDQALASFNRSLKLRREIGYTYGVVTTLGDLSELLLKIGQPDNALKLAKVSKTLAGRIKAKPKEGRAHRILAEIYRAQGRFEDALRHFQLFHEIEKNVFREDAKKKLQHLQIVSKLEASQKQAEINRLKNIELEEKNDELEKLLDQLQKTQAQLIHSEKMASLGKLVAGITHEINTPNGAIISSSDLTARCVEIIDQAMQNEEIRRLFANDAALHKALKVLKSSAETTSSAAERITNLVRSLRSFIRLDQAELQKTDIHEGIDSALVLLENRWRGRIKIVREFENLPEVECFSSELNQALMNLLLNAEQAIEGQGEVKIQTRHIDGYVSVSIGDTGRGIAQEEMKDLFEVRFSQKDQRVKMASGLATVRNIIERHQGTIKVESEVGKGSAFTISLPLKQSSH